MKILHVGVAMMLCAVTLTSCGWPVAEGPPAPSRDQVHQEISQAGFAFSTAINSGDATAIMSFYLEDAQLLPPNSPLISGGPGIQRFWESFVNSTFWRDFTMQIVRVDFRDDLAYVVGTFSLRFQQSGGSPVESEGGKYMIIWKRQEDGAWKIAAEIWNANLSPSLASV